MTSETIPVTAGGTLPPKTPPPGPRRSRVWLWFAAVAILAAVLWFIQSRKPAEAQSPQRTAAGHGRAMGPMVVPVAAAPAHLGSMPVYLDGLGAVGAFYSVTVHTRVDGQLMRVYFQEGQFVQAGALLAEIDPRPFQVQLEQAQGQMAHDQALLSNARLDLARYQTLLQQDAIPKQQLDTQVSAVAQYEGAIKTDQAAIDNARLQLTYSRVTAPISGRVGLRLVDPGNIVHASDANGLLVITQIQPIAVLFTLPEDTLGPVLRKLRAGASLPVEAFNRDKTQKLASGKLLTVDNQIDPTTGTLKLKAVFANTENTLFPQQFVNVRLLVDVHQNQVLVPSVALQRGTQGTFVYVVKPDNTVEVRPITVGIVESGNASIQTGLKAGESVVTDGADKLQPGAKVTIRTGTGVPVQHEGSGPGGGRAGGPRS